MPISHINKIIFVHIPKTGGTSIEKAFMICGNNNFEWENPDNKFNPDILYGYNGRNYVQHFYASEIKDFIGSSVFDSYFKFAFVRNPWERIISEYFYSKRNKQMDFKKFILKIAIPLKETPKELDQSRHFKNQYRFITNEKGEVIVDFIGKFENLKEDFKKICSRLKIDIELPHVNKTANKDYRKFYDNETKNIVSNLYKKDIEMFDYVF